MDSGSSAGNYLQYLYELVSGPRYMYYCSNPQNNPSTSIIQMRKLSLEKLSKLVSGGVNNNNRIIIIVVAILYSFFGLNE